MIKWLKSLFRKKDYSKAVDRAGRRLYDDKGKPIPIEKRVYP